MKYVAPCFLYSSEKWLAADGVPGNKIDNRLSLQQNYGIYTTVLVYISIMHTTHIIKQYFFYLYVNIFFLLLLLFF